MNSEGKISMIGGSCATLFSSSSLYILSTYINQQLAATQDRLSEAYAERYWLSDLLKNVPWVGGILRDVTPKPPSVVELPWWDIYGKINQLDTAQSELVSLQKGDEGGDVLRVDLLRLWFWISLVILAGMSLWVTGLGVKIVLSKIWAMLQKFVMLYFWAVWVALSALLSSFPLLVRMLTVPVRRSLTTLRVSIIGIMDAMITFGSLLKTIKSSISLLVAQKVSSISGNKCRGPRRNIKRIQLARAKREGNNRPVDNQPIPNVPLEEDVSQRKQDRGEEEKGASLQPDIENELKLAGKKWKNSKTKVKFQDGEEEDEVKVVSRPPQMNKESNASRRKRKKSKTKLQNKKKRSRLRTGRGRMKN